MDLNFILEIRKTNNLCEFTLTSGEGQSISVSNLDYPESLENALTTWRKIYQECYQNKKPRAKVVNKGNTTPDDLDAELSKAETNLLNEFHNWLRRKSLYEIRQKITQTTSELTGNDWVNLLIRCYAEDLEYLPWEKWEIATEFGTTGKIRIARYPTRISNKPVTPIHRKGRILAIMADEKGLDFKEDKKAIKSLSKIATVKFIGWQKKQDSTSPKNLKQQVCDAIAEKIGWQKKKEQTSLNNLKQQVCDAIADERGWDVIIFTGHSNEQKVTGGEFWLSPNLSLSIADIQPYIEKAKTKGLQFAIFNSCSGLDIANSLIDLGLNQVVVMREPISHEVAQIFILKFIQSLAAFKDVHKCLIDACNHLETERKITYPSAYLIPSLYRHPQAELFRIIPFGCRERLKQLSLNTIELTILLTLGLVSLQLPIQQSLLDQRIKTQSIYRQLTGQVYSNKYPNLQSNQIPHPLVLVEIDNDSISKAKIKQPNPIDREYLAKIIQKLSELDVKVIGLDYVLDRYDEPKQDQALKQAFQDAVNQQTWLILAQDEVKDMPPISSINWSLRGNIKAPRNHRYLKLLPSEFPNSDEPLPIGYLMALIYRYNLLTDNLNQLQPSLASDKPLLTQLETNLQSYCQQIKLTQQEPNLNIFSDYCQENNLSSPLILDSYRLNYLTAFSYGINQLWLNPILDYSLTPNQVYQCIPAWQLLADNFESTNTQKENPNHCQMPKAEQLKQQVVFIVPGGYEEAGLKEGDDNFKSTPAFRYWTNQNLLTGGEVQAYMFYHFLSQRKVTPIPDLWLLLFAAILAKGTIIILANYPQPKKVLRLSLGGVILGYALVSLQVYISGNILLPILLPSVTFSSFLILQLSQITLKEKAKCLTKITSY